MAKPKAPKRALDSYTVKPINKTIRGKKFLNTFFFFFQQFSWKILEIFLPIETLILSISIHCFSRRLRSFEALWTLEALLCSEDREDRGRQPWGQREGACSMVLSPRGVNRRSPSVPWIQGSLPLRSLWCSERRYHRGKVYGSQFQELYKTGCRRKRRLLLPFRV